MGGYFHFSFQSIDSRCRCQPGGSRGGLTFIWGAPYVIPATEVDEGELVGLRIEEDVLKLHISMEDASRLAVLKSDHELASDVPVCG